MARNHAILSSTVGLLPRCRPTLGGKGGADSALILTLTHPPTREGGTNSKHPVAAVGAHLTSGIILKRAARRSTRGVARTQGAIATGEISDTTTFPIVLTTWPSFVICVHARRDAIKSVRNCEISFAISLAILRKCYNSVINTCVIDNTRWYIWRKWFPGCMPRTIQNI